jgi:hypothetical protein
VCSLSFKRAWCCCSIPAVDSACRNVCDSTQDLASDVLHSSFPHMLHSSSLNMLHIRLNTAQLCVCCNQHGKARVVVWAKGKFSQGCVGKGISMSTCRLHW